MPTLLFLLGGWEWAIVLVVALLLFGGSRLAGIGKGMGRSIREFKEEVKSVNGQDAAGGEEIVDAEIVNPEIDRRDRKPHEG